jgi:hypothetical protein
LKQGHGVHFEEAGIVYTVDSWNSRGLNRSPAGNDGVTLQLRIQPGTESKEGIYSILTFWDATREKNLIISQWGTWLLAQCWVKNRRGRVYYRELALSGGLRHGKPQTAFLTSGREGIICYINSVPGERYPDLTLDPSNFRGRLVLGDAPTGKSQWVGDLFALAIYDRALPAEEMADLGQTPLWGISTQQSKQEDAEAVYAFSEGSGLWVHDRTGLAPDLLIPPDYQRLKRTILMPVWQTFALSWSFLKDVVVNILGFVPLGFFTVLFLERFFRFSRRRASTLAILAGFATSLFIEVVQAYLPTRVSDQLGLILNVAGTCCGVILFQTDLQRFLRRGWLSRLWASGQTTD